MKQSQNGRTAELAASLAVYRTKPGQSVLCRVPRPYLSIRSPFHRIIHLIGILSDRSPDRFVFQFTAQMAHREVPAEQFEHLHLVSLPSEPP